MSSDSPSTESSTTEEDERSEAGEGLFAEKKRALRLTQRHFLGSDNCEYMKESTLTASGMLRSQDRRSLPPLFAQYYRTELHQLVSC